MTVQILNETYEVGSRLVVTTRPTKPPIRELQHEGELLGWYQHPLSASMYLQLKSREGKTVSILSVSIHEVDVLSYRNVATSATPSGRLRARPVIEVTTGVRYHSIQSARRATGCSAGGIMAVLEGRQAATKGFVFRYEEN